MPDRNAMPGKKFPGINQTMRDRKKTPLIILRKNKGTKPINGVNSMAGRRQNAGIGAIIRKYDETQYSLARDGNKLIFSYERT